MKKATLLAAAALAAVTPMVAPAIPYPSQIRVASTSIAPASGTTITYVLNQAAATATVEILDGSNTVVASFPGGTAIGLNTVVWNGTVNNAAGAALPTGSGYRVRVAVTGTEGAGWARIKAQGSPTSDVPTAGGIIETDLGSDFFPKGLLVNTDPDSDNFGNKYITFGGNTANDQSGAVMVLRADLDTPGGDNGVTSRILRSPTDDGVAPNPGAYAVWGASFDDGNVDRIYYGGQAGVNNPEFMFGTFDGTSWPANATNADPTLVYPTSPATNSRSLVVKTVGSTKYGFVARGNAVVEAVTINTDGTFGTLVGNILSTTGWTNTDARYSKNVKFDAAGNMYWGSQRINTTAGSENGKLYRWSAATVAAAIANPAGTPLTEANADWIITNDIVTPGTNQRVAAFCINPATNDVYVLTGRAGLFLVGNAVSSVTPYTVGMSTLTALVPTTEFRPAAALNAGTCEMEFDAAGNLIVVEGGSENVYALTPGGASAQTFTAPASQTFAITSSVSDWMNFSR